MECTPLIKGVSKANLSSAIVKHYKKHKRDLPWRQNQDPYRIWVSEIMLQQTQVKTVIPYFNRWVKRFPTVESLAKAKIETVLSFWTGLGYYRRCRFLHEGAQQTVNEHNGKIPDTPERLQKIKGIGKYTAGAISSIAFGLPAPIVDGNVERLLSRVFRIEHDVKSKEGQTLLWQLAQWLIPPKSASDFNQGMMELGATVCKPKNPDCQRCPLQAYCRAKKHGDIDSFPIKAKRIGTKEKKKIPYKVAWLTRRQKILLCRRHANGLFPGVWELPHAETKASLKKLFTNPTDVMPKSIIHFEHVLSHRLLDIKLYPAEIEGKAKLRNDLIFDKNKWFSPNELSTIGLSSAMKTIIEKQLGVKA